MLDSGVLYRFFCYLILKLVCTSCILVKVQYLDLINNYGDDATDKMFKANFNASS
jgi:hypothetical protein